MIDWLEWLRKNGEDSSFVRSLPSWREDPAIARLIESLERGHRSLLRRLTGTGESAVQVVRRAVEEEQASAAQPLALAAPRR